MSYMTPLLGITVITYDSSWSLLYPCVRKWSWIHRFKHRLNRSGPNHNWKPLWTFCTLDHRTTVDAANRQNSPLEMIRSVLSIWESSLFFLFSSRLSCARIDCYEKVPYNYPEKNPNITLHLTLIFSTTYIFWSPTNSKEFFGPYLHHHRVTSSYQNSLAILRIGAAGSAGLAGTADFRFPRNYPGSNS